MNKFLYLIIGMSLISNVCSSMEAPDFAVASKAKRISLSKQTASPKLLGRYLYCQHALLRMNERGFNYPDIEYAINKGDRYRTPESRQLCTNLDKHLAVIFDQKTETVVTVLKFGPKRLENWKAQRDNATNKEKEKAFKRQKKLDKFLSNKTQESNIKMSLNFFEHDEIDE